MLRQEYSHLVDAAERERIIALVNRVIDTLGSRDISIDDKHTPKLYSRFLSSTLSRQQAAAREARSRSRRTTSTPKTASTPLSVQHSPPNSLHTPAQTQFPTLQSLQHVQGGPSVHNPSDLLHVLDTYDVSDAGTDATIERHDELPADEMLAGMHALNNPAWWNNVMMPGYSWQSEVPVYVPSYGAGVGYTGQQQPQHMPQQPMAPLQQPTQSLPYMGPR